MLNVFTLRHEGSIMRTSNGPHKCGPDGRHTYDYLIEIETSQPLRPPRFFILDRASMDQAVEAFFQVHISTSCERIAEVICEIICRMLAEEKRACHWVRVTVSGDGGKGSLSCERRFQ